MATPKFDAISVEFAKMIGDPVATAATNGNILTAAKRNAYVNKALSEFFSRKWLELGGDVQAFVSLFPELMKMENLDLQEPGNNYLDVSAKKNYVKVVSGYMSYAAGASVIYFEPGNSGEYQVYMAGAHSSYVRDASEPVLVDRPNAIGTAIDVFPQNLYETTNEATISLAYIINALDPSTGAALTQGGSNDSPFAYSWFSTIAMIAYELYKIDAQVS